MENVSQADSRGAKYAMFAFNLKGELGTKYKSEHCGKECVEGPGHSLKGGHHVDQGWTHKNKDKKSQTQPVFKSTSEFKICFHVMFIRMKEHVSYQ